MVWQHPSLLPHRHHHLKDSNGNAGSHQHQRQPDVSRMMLADPHPPRHRRQQDELLRQRMREHRERGGGEPVTDDTAFAFDYHQPAVPHAGTLPDPPASSCSTLVVLVLSARSHRRRRAVIRDTWGHGHAVYFVIGGAAVHKKKNAASVMADQEDDDEQMLSLRQEQEQHQDLIDAVHPDSYASLPHKLRFGLRWVVQQQQTCYNHNNATTKPTQWILKVDDDTYARVDRLQQKLLPLLNPATPMVVGRVVRHHAVPRTGPWAEDFSKYNRTVYPPWPQGSCGYLVSRPVAAHVARRYEHLRLYQGEDTGLGIWLDEASSSLDVTWVHSPFFVNHGNCLLGVRGNNNNNSNNVPLVVGHKISPNLMELCYESEIEWAAANTNRTATSATERLFYLETHPQRLAAAAANGEQHTFDNEAWKETPEYRTAVERQRGQQELEERQAQANQRTQERAKKRHELQQHQRQQKQEHDA